ncbi:MAG: tetratricopeptide repeat protein [Treponema sp.]
MRKIVVGTVLLWVNLMVFADPISLFEKGKELQYRENWYEAIELYQEALKENPAYNAVYYSLAECFYALAEYDQALVYIEKARLYTPKNVDTENLYAFILIGLGKIREAAQTFSAVLEYAPNNLDARFGMAEIEVGNGRLTNASELYKAALQRQIENRKALLSLALLNYETGNIKIAQSYISRALEYHGDNPQVHYLAGYLAALTGDAEEAEGRIRAALTINPHYDAARALLASLMYASQRYHEAIAEADIRIAANRNLIDAWYLKTLCLISIKHHTEALKTAQTGLSIEPDNELMRTLVEGIALNTLDFEHKTRKELAKNHSVKAAGFITRNMTDQGVYEYRRALKMYPYDSSSRQAYAKILMRQGFPERSIEQLQFIQSIEKSNAQINDTVEAYTKMLDHSVRNRWHIDPLYLNKAHLSIGLFYQANPANVLHPEAEKYAASLIADVFSYNRRFAVTPYLDSASSYKEAFKTARTQKNDYFGIISLKENERDIQITLDLYVGRTGSIADSFVVYRSGNDRYSNAIRRITEMFNQRMPIIGKIVERSQNEAVIDIGSGDCDLAAFTVDILKKDTLSVANEGINLIYNEADKLGTFTVQRISEDLTEGTLTRIGYYDKMTKADIVILTPKDAKKDTDEELGHVQRQTMEMSALLSLLRSIRS